MERTTDLLCSPLAPVEQFIPTAIQDLFQADQNRQRRKIVTRLKVLDVTSARANFFRHHLLGQLLPVP